MDSLLANGSAEISGHFNLALLFGLIILGGALGARLSQKIHVPQVVGCIVVGILLGDVLGLITTEKIDSLEPFTMFALGVIGFMIGGELRGEVFKKYGRQFFIILFSQGLGGFLLVAIGVSAVSWLALPSLFPGEMGVAVRLRISLGMGLVLGAIASATAPAATANVLWEYKTRGPLTAAVLAIVALDDALALLLYRGAATGAKALTGTGHSSIFGATALLLGEIVGAVLLGFLAGVLLYFLLKLVRAEDKILEFALASLLLVVGLSMIPKIDPILPAMALGITIANLMPRQSKGTFKLVEKFSPPIYVSFFVLAGAHMRFSTLVPWVIVVIVVFTLCRAAGKIVGAWLGARHSGAPAAVQKYLGICLLPQAGVAIGLAILAGRQFESKLGETIVIVAMTSTFVMEIFGPLLVKAGVRRAGEVGMNVTEEDLIKTYKVGDVMDRKPTSIPQDMELREILKVFSGSESVYYPVLGGESRIIGVVTIADIKEMFANQDVAGWLLACDVAGPVRDKTTAERPLEEVIEHMRRYDLDNVPVVANLDDDQLVGVLDYHKTLRNISAEVLHRREAADRLASAPI
ncbi:MAG: cation:proton antiporter [Phycisphaerales bacterium]|nr:MAG: cation:proton antiporter [Phycisphaerales bacterium]